MPLDQTEKCLHEYELAFKKFVDIYEKYLDVEDNEENKTIAMDAYNVQKEADVWLRRQIETERTKQRQDSSRQCGQSVKSIGTKYSTKSRSIASSRRSFYRIYK